MKTKNGSSTTPAGQAASGNRFAKGSGLKPHEPQRAPELQKFDELVTLPPIGLDQEACQSSVKHLNQLLADTISLRDMYKKHHWQVTGHTFYQLHLLFDKHYQEQAELTDTLAERVQALGGVSVAMGGDVAELTQIEKPPKGREPVPVQLSRLLEAHETILKYGRRAAKAADEVGDCGTNDFLAGDFTRTNEIQVWFLAQHLVDVNAVDAVDGAKNGETN